MDVPLVVKVVLSTASIERVTIFDLLLTHKGKMTTSQIENSLNISNHTDHRTMADKPLDFSPNYYIKYNLNSAIRIGYLPMKFDDLEVENIKLYNILKDKIFDKT
jgi:hypothetical protein